MLKLRRAQKLKRSFKGSMQLETWNNMKLPIKIENFDQPIKLIYQCTRFFVA